MNTPRTLVPLVFLALVSTFGCQTAKTTATVEIPIAETPQDKSLIEIGRDRLFADKNGLGACSALNDLRDDYSLQFRSVVKA